jgi:hypothetical protein
MPTRGIVRFEYRYRVAPAYSSPPVSTQGSFLTPAFRAWPIRAMSSWNQGCLPEGVWSAGGLILILRISISGSSADPFLLPRPWITRAGKREIRFRPALFALRFLECQTGKVSEEQLVTEHFLNIGFAMKAI